MLKYIFLISLLIFTGCSTKISSLDGEIIKERNIKEESFTTRTYTNISKDAIFEAAKKVFILAGKEQFRIDSYRDILIVSKTKMNHFPFIAFTIDDFWELTINEKNNTSYAKLELYRIYDHKEENVEYITKDSHELLWGRIEYILGLSDSWTSCSNYIDFNDVLCDSIDMYNRKDAKKEDVLKDILIVDRKSSKSLNEIDEDILRNDIELSIDGIEEDILSKEDNIDSNIEVNEAEKALADSFDKEIEELDRKVNKNIDETLDKIENNIDDEVVPKQE